MCSRGLRTRKRVDKARVKGIVAKRQDKGDKSMTVSKYLGAILIKQITRER